MFVDKIAEPRDSAGVSTELDFSWTIRTFSSSYIPMPTCVAAIILHSMFAGSGASEMRRESEAGTQHTKSREGSLSSRKCPTLETAIFP